MNRVLGAVVEADAAAAALALIDVEGLLLFAGDGIHGAVPGTLGAADAAGLNFEIVYDSNDDNSSSVLKTKSKNTDPTYYVINAGGDNGYVIVAGDDEAETILGYTLDGRVDTDNIPANMLSWLEFYDSEIADLRSQTPARGMAVGELTDPADQYTNVIYPLLRDTKWNQDAPYNAQCPTYNGRSTYVGCVATAIGQIIYYNRYPTQPEGSVNYTTDAPYNINVRANFAPARQSSRQKSQSSYSTSVRLQG